MANIIHTDQCTAIRHSWDDDKPITVELSIGNDKAEEDPVGIAMRTLAGLWNAVGDAARRRLNVLMMLKLEGPLEDEDQLPTSASDDVGKTYWIGYIWWIWTGDHWQKAVASTKVPHT